MLDRDTVRDFFRFLDTASDRQLVERQQEINDLLQLLPRGSDVRKDYSFLSRKLAEEQAARFNVAQVRAEYQRKKQR